jgi:hypothetical protein
MAASYDFPDNAVKSGDYKNDPEYAPLNTSPSFTPVVQVGPVTPSTIQNSVFPSLSATISWASLRIINAVSYAGFLGVNYLSNTGFFGLTNGQVTDKYPITFAPANYAFAIWGLISLADLVLCAYTFVPNARNNATLNAALPWWAGNFIGCMIWSYLFSTEQLVAATCLLAMTWFCSFMAWKTVTMSGRIPTPSHSGEETPKTFWSSCKDFMFGSSSWHEALFLKFPVSLTFAWLTGAMVLGVVIACKAHPATEFIADSPIIGAGIELALWSIVTAVFVVGRQDCTVGSVSAWTFLAISVQGSPYDKPLLNRAVAGVMGVTSLILVVTLAAFNIAKLVYFSRRH